MSSAHDPRGRQPGRVDEKPAWPLTVASKTARFADALNDQFVSLARRADGLMRKAEHVVTNRLAGRSATPVEVEADKQREIQNGLARWARIRLSDLHLRVGENIYQLDRAENPAAASIRRQLLALLDEIERLEEVLLRANVQADDANEGQLAQGQGLSQLDLATERRGSDEVSRWNGGGDLPWRTDDRDPEQEIPRAHRQGGGEGAEGG